MLPGGGSSLIHASKLLDFVEGDNKEQDFGISILKKAIKKPAEILFDNAGKNGRYIVENILEQQDNRIGFNLRTGTDIYIKFIIFFLICQITFRKIRGYDR